MVSAILTNLTDAHSKKSIQDSLPPVMANFALYNRTSLKTKNNYCRKRVYIGDIKKVLGVQVIK